MNLKNCCILYNEPHEGAMADELDVLDQVEYIDKNLSKAGINTFRQGITSDFMDEVASLAAGRPECVFNLVESINNKGELCYFVPALLNMYSIPYSGNSLEAMFITTSKALSGNIMNKEGIATPRNYFPSEFKKLKAGNPYIIKPVWEDGSLGITVDSVFTYEPGYEKNLSGFDDNHWIIQEFIEGREFNISVLSGRNGPQIMPAAEMVFHNFGHERPRIVDFKAKWLPESFEYKNTIREFPGDKLDALLRNRINELALKCWHVFGLKGYARVDMRVDIYGNPFVIEVNANPCLSPDGGLFAATSEAGLSAVDVLLRILSDLNT